MAQEFSLGPDGGLQRAGSRFVPIGVNYPLDEIWADASSRQVTPAAQIDRLRADLDAMAALGLNAVRFRVPPSAVVPGLRSLGSGEVARWCDERGLAVTGVGLLPDDAAGVMPLTAFAEVEFSCRPGNHAVGFDGLTDPFLHTLLPFAVREARRRQPVLVTSLATGGALGPRVVETWLRATLPAAASAGAAGFFWADWRGPDGLVDQRGQVQPSRTAFIAVAREAMADAGGAAQPADIGLFFPQARQPGGEVLRRLMLANYFLGKLGFAAAAVDASNLERTPVRAVLLAGVPLDARDRAALQAWTIAGGELFWHGPDPLDWDNEMSAWLGAQVVDWRSPRGISVSTFGERFTLAHFPHDVRAEFAPAGATVLATDQQGLPVLLENRIGNGRVRWMAPLVEEAIAPVATHPAARDRWVAWYRGMLDRGGDR